MNSPVSPRFFSRPLVSLTLVVLAMLAPGSARAQDTTAEPEAPDHLFLLVGQSNMAGRAVLEAQDQGIIPGAFLWNFETGAWEPAEAPLNRYSPHRKTQTPSRLNPGVGFVKAYLKKHPEVTVGIICCARGGTSIEEWDKGRQEPWPLYDTAFAATQQALAKGGELKGILWHQGESNSGAAGAYPDKLAKLIANFRADLEAPGLPFIFSQVGQWNEKYAAFNEMIVEQPANIPHTACVKTDELTAMDQAHFDSASQRELGARFAKAFEELTQ